MDGVADHAARLHTEQSLAAQQADQQREHENVQTRLFIMTEEVDDLTEAMQDCTHNESHEQAEIARLDQAALDVDRQVREFMEQIKEKKHALACARYACMCMCPASTSLLC